ncbi:hypothetical protein [Luteibacter sp.]|uniref:hypothetical protein n=1 Tax=Luteibacter sp. TaxID=1886636 RepID=UPI002F4181CA
MVTNGLGEDRPHFVVGLPRGFRLAPGRGGAHLADGGALLFKFRDVLRKVRLLPADGRVARGVSCGIARTGGVGLP